MAQVTVKSSGGQFGTIDEKDLDQALTRGFTVPSNDEIQEYNDRLEHGTSVSSAAGAALEEAAGTATFGLSRELENLTGLTTPEAQAARAKYNPIASNVVGPAIGLIADPFGVLGKVSKVGGKVAETAGKVIGPAAEDASLLARASRNVPAAAAGAATEGAIYGAGQTIAQDAMGDHEARGEHLLANVGYGALFAGALGASLEGAGNIFGISGVKRFPEKAIGDAAKAEPLANDITAGVTPTPIAEASAEASAAERMAENAPFKEMPKSLEEIKQAVKTNFPIVPEGLPSHAALKDAVDALPDLQFKPHNLQYESLTDQHLRDYYKTFLEANSDYSKALRDYEGLQKQEAVVKLDNTIKDLTGGKALSPDVTSAGESAVEKFTNQYQKEKDELGPLFKQFDKIAGGKNLSSFHSLVKLQDVFPDIGRYLTSDTDGVFKLAKYEPTMPFSKNVYGAVKELVESANKKELTLAELRNLRETMRDRLDPLKPSRDDIHIGDMRKILMDQMEESISKAAPDLAVRDTFRRYAQNEEKRAIIEKVLGGSISNRATFAKTIKPEDVLDKIFSNSVSVKAAKEILGNDFNSVLADYLNQKRLKVTDEARIGFSSNKFATFLKGKRPELVEALAQSPDSLKRIAALTDYMRILPDSPPVNPSGTAKTLGIMEKIAGLSKMLKPTNAIEDFANRFMEKAQAEKQRLTLNEVMAGKTFGAAKEAADESAIRASRMARIERAIENTAYRVEANAKAIFKGTLSAAKKSVGLVGSKLAPTPQHKVPTNDGDISANDKAHDVFAKVMELNSDPQKMADELQKHTTALFMANPNLSLGVQVAATKATNFLAMKAPKIPPYNPLTKSRVEPSTNELAVFERYYNAVEDPVGVMADVKDGSLTRESIETLDTVYPRLYNSMKQAILEQVADYSSKEPLPYRLRQSVSMFLGEPVDSALSGQSIAANQATFSAANVAGSAQGPIKARAGGMKDMTVALRTGLSGQKEEA